MYRYIRDGWPDEPLDEDSDPYKRRYLKMSIAKDILM